MKRTVSQLAAIIDSTFIENSNESISGTDLNSFVIDLSDSLSSGDENVQAYQIRFKVSDLDSNLAVSIVHDLNSIDIKPVFYTETGIRIFREFYTFQVVDADTVTLTFLSGIKFDTHIKGFFYITD